MKMGLPRGWSEECAVPASGEWGVGSGKGTFSDRKFASLKGAGPAFASLLRAQRLRLCDVTGPPTPLSGLLQMLGKHRCSVACHCQCHCHLIGSLVPQASRGSGTHGDTL